MTLAARIAALEKVWVCQWQTTPGGPECGVGGRALDPAAALQAHYLTRHSAEPTRPPSRPTPTGRNTVAP